MIQSNIKQRQGKYRQIKTPADINAGVLFSVAGTFSTEG